jgi:hypothetical protein
MQKIMFNERYKDAPNLIRKAVHYYGEECKAGWNNKMFVKAEYMPRHIKITGLKVEGLAGISDEDCLKEGIYELKLCESEDCVYTFQGDHCGMWKTPYLAYKELIDRLNRRGFFESNPLVYAYTYELVD